VNASLAALAAIVVLALVLQGAVHLVIFAAYLLNTVRDVR